MLHVEIENIMSEEDAVAKARQLIDRVDIEKQLIVITRQNRPAVAMIDVPRLEELTGKTVTPVAPASTVIEHLNSFDAGELSPAAEESVPDMPVPEMEFVPEPAPQQEVAMESMGMAPVAPVVPEPQPITPPPFEPAPAYEPQQAVAEPTPLPPMEAVAPQPVQSMQPAQPVPPVQPIQPSYPPVPPQQVASQTDQLPDMPLDPTNGSPLA